MEAQRQQNYAEQLIKKQARLQQIRNKMLEANDPAKARKQAPLGTAKRLVGNVKQLLGLKETATEATYLQKLINQLYKKASEKYKEQHKKEPENIYQAVAFALENASSQSEMWRSLRNAIHSDIDADTTLDDMQKEDMKNFIDTYIDTAISTLLTEHQQNNTVTQILKDKYGKTKENGNVVIDWDAILRDAKTKEDVHDRIDEVIDGLGHTGAEVEQFKQSLKDRFDSIYSDKVRRRVKMYLNSKVKNKVQRELSQCLKK